MFYTIDKAQGRLFISFLVEQPANIGECVHVNKLKRRTKQKQNKVGPGWSSTGNQIVSLFSFWCDSASWTNYRMWVQSWFPSNSQTLSPWNRFNFPLIAFLQKRSPLTLHHESLLLLSSQHGICVFFPLYEQICPCGVFIIHCDDEQRGHMQQGPRLDLNKWCCG